MVVNLPCAIVTVISPWEEIEFDRSSTDKSRERAVVRISITSRKSCPRTPTSPAPLSMEAFHLLSRGGIKFDKQKYRDDVRLFNVSHVVAILQRSNRSCPQVEVKHPGQKCASFGESEERTPTRRVGFLQVYPRRGTEEEVAVGRAWRSEETKETGK